MTHADETAPAAPQAFKVGDAVRRKPDGGLATVERVFTSAMPGLETACALACRIENGGPVYIYAASELEPA